MMEMRRRKVRRAGPGPDVIYFLYLLTPAEGFSVAQRRVGGTGATCGDLEMRGVSLRLVVLGPPSLSFFDLDVSPGTTSVAS